MMKIFLLFVTLLGATHSAVAASDYKAWCPFYKERPPMAPDMFAMYLEPMEFVLQHKETFCKKWVAKLEAAYLAILKFNDKTLTNPPPIEPNTERALLLNAIQDLFFDTNTMLKQGRTCGGTEIPQESPLESVLVQLARTFYSTHDSIRRSASYAHGILKMPKDIADAIQGLKQSWDAQLAFNEEKFRKYACLELEREFIRQRCRPIPRDSIGGGVEPVPGLTEQELASVQWVKGRSEVYLSGLKKVSRIMGEQKKGPIDHLTSKIPTPKPKKPQFNSDLDVIDAYYQQISPLLKLCGLEASFSDVPPADPLFPLLSKLLPAGQRAFPAACEQFFCPNHDGLLKDPRAVNQITRSTEAEQKAAVAQFNEQKRQALCHFTDNYEQLSNRYLAGFKEYIAEYQRTGKVPKRGFCPSEAIPRRELSEPHGGQPQQPIHQPLFDPPPVPR